MFAGLARSRCGIRAQGVRDDSWRGARNVISQAHKIMWKTDESAFCELSVLQSSNVRDLYPPSRILRALTLKVFALERYLPPIVALLSNDHHAPQRGGRFLCANNSVVISYAVVMV